MYTQKYNNRAVCTIEAIIDLGKLPDPPPSTTFVDPPCKLVQSSPLILPLSGLGENWPYED